jgi:hypothetical protein
MVDIQKNAETANDHENPDESHIELLRPNTAGHSPDVAVANKQYFTKENKIKPS